MFPASDGLLRILYDVVMAPGIYIQCRLSLSRLSEFSFVLSSRLFCAVIWNTFQFLTVSLSTRHVSIFEVFSESETRFNFNVFSESETHFNF